jgi:hypothetical protein
MFNQHLKFGIAIILLMNSQFTLANSSKQIAEQASRTNHSVGQFKQTITNSALSTSDMLEKTETTLRTLKQRGMQRDAVSISRQKSATVTTVAKTAQAHTQTVSAENFDHSFSIYSANRELLTDVDFDGYYQTFSVSFDADILSSVTNEQAFVYADLYLSKNGGPWVLYFSTDDFLITGENTDDEFEVITRLDSGYTPDHYDVLIDLIEVGYSDVVATYSSDDSNALYALPLESSDYDPEYIEVEFVDEHGGSINWATLSLLLLLVIRRR